tara:strand:+ start:12347 stop:12700 length:354 start_codon:yes stop_codon:yes gene_type:complete
MIINNLTSNVSVLYAREIGLTTFFFDDYVLQFKKSLCRAKRKPFYTDRLSFIIRLVVTSVSSTPLIIGLGLKKINNLFGILMMKIYALIAFFLLTPSCEDYTPFNDIYYASIEVKHV